MKRCLALSAIVCLLAFDLLRAQGVPRAEDLAIPEPDTLIRRNALSLIFDRNLNTYNWVDRISLDTSFSGFSFRLRQQLLSNIVRTDPSPAAARQTLESNRNNITFSVARRIDDDIDVRSEWSSLTYSDNKSEGLNNSSFHNVLGGIGYTPGSVFSVAPMAGYRWDKQGDNRDRGPSVHVTANTRGATLDGYALAGEGQFHIDFLSPRRLESHFATVGVQKHFTALTRDSLEAGYLRVRREFYTNADSAIESRAEELFFLANQLDYNLFRNTLARIFVNISMRGLDKDTRARPGITPDGQRFDTRIEEFRLSAFLELFYRSDDGRTAASARLSYAERDESHIAKLPDDASPNTSILWNQRNRQEQTKDNISRRTALAGAVSVPLSSVDDLAVSASAGILRYDTPSLLNVDDRDELLIALRIASRHRLSRFLHVDIALDGNLSRLVYILKERSANNNTNRVLRLAPTITYRPAQIFTSVNTFEVLANYTVYEFEQQVAFVKSFSYRQFAWLDSTAINLTRRVGLDFFAYLKLYERGQLRWDEFKERTESSFLDQTFTLQLRFQPDTKILFAAGLRYFSQSRYQHEQEGKRLVSFLRSVGPTCLLMWQVGSHSRIDFRGWYEVRRLADGSTKAQPSMTLNLLVSM